MNKRTRRTVWAIAFLALASSGVQAREWSIEEILAMAEKTSPVLSAARLREAEARYGVGEARAGYFPTLQWDEMDSSRFPESSETLGIGGLIGAPYRSGRISAGVAKETLYDFGRTRYGVRAAEAEVDFRRQDTRVARYAVEAAALSAYYDCARDRSQAEAWKDISAKSRLVAAQIDHFVKTGQRSIVDRMLADTQTQDAEIREADFGAREQDARERLSVWTGVPAKDLECPSLPPSEEGIPSAATETSRGASPFVARAEADSSAAQLRMRQVRSDYWPTLVAAGSAGNLQAVGVKNQAAYAFAAGIAVPIFDGMKTPERVGRAEAAASEKERELDVVRQEVSDLNARYNEEIDSSRTRLERLDLELREVQRAFDVAKRRYFSFSGTVVDLRESLRNLAQTSNDLNEARAQLLKSTGNKALLNGAY